MNDVSIYADVEESISDLLARAAERGGGAFAGAANPDTAAAVAEMGWSQLTVPQDAGGLGLGLAGLGPTLRRLGEHLVPGAWADQVVLGALVPQVGGRVAVLADPQASGNPKRVAPPTLTASGVSGTVPLVSWDEAAECLLVPADGSLLLVGRDAPGVRLTRLDTDDPVHPLATLELDQVRLGDVDVVATGDEADRLHREILAWTRIFIACELSGIAARVTAESLAYAGQREQFGRPVGSFQAVKHLLAEMTTATEALSALCSATLDDVGDASDGGELGSWVLKAYASDAAVRVCETGLQVHGGIGFTAEYGLHRFLRRGYFLATWFGGTGDLVARIGRRRLESP
jgi:alkylation response protein AidB-like acyl-CoA dehydrogenase